MRGQKLDYNDGVVLSSYYNGGSGRIQLTTVLKLLRNLLGLDEGT